MALADTINNWDNTLAGMDLLYKYNKHSTSLKNQIFFAIENLIKKVLMNYWLKADFSAKKKEKKY
jgi:hypothetical protein